LARSRGIDSATEADEVRAKYAEWILEKSAALLLLHLLALDHLEHETGPFSEEDIAALEQLDTPLENCARRRSECFPRAVIFAVVSDHGFRESGEADEFWPAFVRAGLIYARCEEKVKGWKAFPWDGRVGGDSVKDRDTVVAAQVRVL